MSLLGKLMNSIRLSNGDGDDCSLDDEEYDDDKPARKGLFGKKNEDFCEDENEGNEPAKPKFLSRNKVAPMKQWTGMKVSMVKPTSIKGAKEIYDYLLVGRAVMPNMEGLHIEMAQGIIGFMPGTTYSMSGNLQKISSYIFIATPRSVELPGDFQDLFGGGSLGIPGVNLQI